MTCLLTCVRRNDLKIAERLDMALGVTMILSEIETVRDKSTELPDKTTNCLLSLSLSPDKTINLPGYSYFPAFGTGGRGPGDYLAAEPRLRPTTSAIGVRRRLAPHLFHDQASRGVEERRCWRPRARTLALHIAAEAHVLRRRRRLASPHSMELKHCFHLLQQKKRHFCAIYI